MSAHTLTIKAGRWRSAEDFYDGLLTALKAPAWHGRNFHALRDSLLTGDINGIEPPLRLVFQTIPSPGTGARATLDQFCDLLSELSTELQASGRTIELVLPNPVGVSLAERKTRFRILRRLCVAAVVSMLFALILLGFSRPRSWRSPRFVVAIVLGGAGLIFLVRYWRCPACGHNLENNWPTKNCPWCHLVIR